MVSTGESDFEGMVKHDFADIYRLCCHIFVVEKEWYARGLNMRHLEKKIR